MFPPESAKDYVKYFGDLSGVSTNSKWRVGLQAAKVWADYCNPHNNKQPIYLEQAIKILCPYRNSGSGFLALWMDILIAIQDLPVEIQVYIWTEIFDTKNHGDKPIQNNEKSKSVLVQWLTLSKSGDTTAIESALLEIAEITCHEFLSGHEWVKLMYAIDKWYKNINHGFSFSELVLEQILKAGT